MLSLNRHANQTTKFHRIHCKGLKDYLFLILGQIYYKHLRQTGIKRSGKSLSIRIFNHWLVLSIHDKCSEYGIPFFKYSKSNHLLHGNTYWLFAEIGVFHSKHWHIQKQYYDIFSAYFIKLPPFDSRHWGKQLKLRWPLCTSDQYILIS